MIFRKKKQPHKSENANEYKRGYYDGYNNGLNNLSANHNGFNNNSDYLKGYNYGYQMGKSEARQKEKMLNSQSEISKPISPKKVNYNDQVNMRKEVGLSKPMNESQNPNMHNNFYNKRF